MAEKEMGNSKGKHTGKIRHKDMTSLIDGHPGRDPHADPEHHRMNKEHGMPDGMHPQGEYGEGEEGEGEMSGNEEQC